MALLISFGLWLITLGTSGLCLYFFLVEVTPRELKEREIYLIAGTGEYTCRWVSSTEMER